MREEKLHQKGTTSVVGGGPLYLGNKKRFRDWAGVKDTRGCVS